MYFFGIFLGKLYQFFGIFLDKLYQMPVNYNFWENSVGFSTLSILIT